jgi:predicted transcriptional regulator of viral defense system
MKWSIIKKFSGKNILGFSPQDVSREFPDKNPAYLARILSDMVDLGMLCKISRGIYHIIPSNADPETYVPAGHQVAKYLMQNKEYYIGYASAMRLHGLTLKYKDYEYVVTKTQMKPAIRSSCGISIQFIHHDVTRFFGFSSIWINHDEKAIVSDLERTIVDITTKPQLCGGIVEVGNAIFQTRDRTDHDKLFYSFARNMNKSAKKRFLFLTDLLGMDWTADHERMMEEVGSGISILDPAAPDQGKRWQRYGLKMNVDPLLIKNKILDPDK